ncbi:MAG: hypothetical protein DRP54_05500 [Spirochaetes bacterium]|nr:MAG: hypothetical protein DRP54_05500 [Spirochaetota bacterium]
MGKRIKLNIEGRELFAELNDSTTSKIFAIKLPMTIKMERWGGEYYGDCDVSVNKENGAKTEMEIGEIAIWPDGCALCIFFGPTPASVDEKPRAISPVNPIGKIEGDVSFLNELPQSIEVRVEEA